MNRPRPFEPLPIREDEIQASVSRLKEMTHALSNLVGLTMNHLELCSMHLAKVDNPVLEHFQSAEKLATMSTEQLRCLMLEISYLHSLSHTRMSDKDEDA